MERESSARLIQAGRGAVRAYGRATRWARPWPDFILIGAKRGGTTSLYYDLLQHPKIVPLFPSARGLPLKRNDTKGVHYFDKHYRQGPEWYRSHFPSRARRWAAGSGATSGEASPYMLHHPLAAQRAASLLPTVRLIALLRDPVERTYSHYREQVRNGFEQLSFEEALRAEPERTENEELALVQGRTQRSAVHEHHSYAAQSNYDLQLSRWLDRYPREHLLVVLSEDYYRDPQATVNLVCAHLGLPNAAVATERRNAAPPGRMQAATRAALRQRFDPVTRYVENLIGRETGWGRGD